MHKLICKRGYKRYMDFNHNRFILLVKEWYTDKLMIDFYYNEQFLGYIKTEASWADLFNSDSSDVLIVNLIKENDKMKDYEDIFMSMNLSEENLVFIDKQFQLYVTVPYHQKANLKVCRLSSFKEKRVLQQCSLDVYVYQEIYNSCIEYLDRLTKITDDLVRLCDSERPLILG